MTRVVGRSRLWPLVGLGLLLVAGLAIRLRQGVLEPPVIEVVVAAAYRLAGGERFWIPRIVSSLFWLGGGVALYLGMVAWRTLRTQAGSSWLPGLLLDPFFWRGWRANVEDVVGLPLLLAALMGLLVDRQYQPRWLLTRP